MPAMLPVMLLCKTPWLNSCRYKRRHMASVCCRLDLKLRHAARTVNLERWHHVPEGRCAPCTLLWLALSLPGLMAQRMQDQVQALSQYVVQADHDANQQRRATWERLRHLERGFVHMPSCSFASCGVLMAQQMQFECELMAGVLCRLALRGAGAAANLEERR